MGRDKGTPQNCTDVVRPRSPRPQPGTSKRMAHLHARWAWDPACPDQSEIFYSPPPEGGGTGLGIWAGARGMRGQKRGGAGRPPRWGGGGSRGGDGGAAGGRRGGLAGPGTLAAAGVTGPGERRGPGAAEGGRPRRGGGRGAGRVGAVWGRRAGG